MAQCLLCGQAAELGLLCNTHIAALSPRSSLTAAQIVARAEARSLAWLVDQWGCTHAIGADTQIGRSYEHCSLTIMHHTVSSRHARIEQHGGTFYVIDARSLNGTYVDDVAVFQAPLRHGSRVVFGEVSFYFAMQAVPLAAPPPGVGGTVPMRTLDLLQNSIVLRNGRGVVELLHRHGGGGVLRTENDTLELAALECSLLSVLIDQARRMREPELRFVATAELVRRLDFRSRSADDENLRELIQRVRRKLRTLDIGDLIESRRGAGYRLTWDVD